MIYTTTLLAALAALTTAQNCPISFEGRPSATASLTDFDNANLTTFNPSFVLGFQTKWSQVLAFPRQRTGTLFAKATEHKAVEMRINDASIFQPNAADATSRQTGFRRSELIPVKFPKATDNLDSTSGIKTFHFSIKAVPSRPLNYSHEYQLAFLEDSSFSTNQFVLKTGTIIGSTTPAVPTLQVQTNQKNASTIFSTPFDQKVYYSTGNSALVAKTGPVANDNSGNGEFHFGLLKKPTGGDPDVTKKGFQSSGIDERLSFAGVFQEDSTGGCVSLGGKVRRG
ncbi:hypothetical protein KVT40_004363 [Elsinoe batatas]|uniref:Glycoside hydrolase 131 catalytic N-terminal domain-containing protein n=1 Tax=Elsinoe batatas TaxID=2601811 RepID=A0A8K0L400_9PEZI|nr:hypothetical protein KVT40_004363 [Elsinoe batatas]